MATDVQHRLPPMLLQVLEAVARAVEGREPHGLGHQRRVARLAEAIALEMGFPEERLPGLQLAALLQDLGMMGVPCGILHRPGPLREGEYDLIKHHPDHGYEALKDLDLPWPVASIVRQHHERLDGSGYPQGLQGEQILMEARILAVADVVAAMGWPRSYRPALGIARALDELQAFRGARYEPAAVDACLRLFEEGRFRFVD